MQKKEISALLKEEHFYNYCFKKDDNDTLFWEKHLADHPEDRWQVVCTSQNSDQLKV